MTGPVRRAGRLGRRVLAVPATGAMGALLLLVPAVPAAAHVSVERAVPAGDGTATVVFSLDHGCSGSPTTSVEVSVPAGVELITGVTEQPTGWTAQQRGEGVRWSGPGIPDGQQAEFAVRVRLSGTVGQAFRFPAVQGCADGGSSAWTGEDGSDTPTPVLIATGAVLAPPDGTTPDGGAGLGAALGAVGVLVVLAAGGGGAYARRSGARAGAGSGRRSL